MIPPRKVTLNLDGDAYDRLQSYLYHGQLTRMFRRFIECMNHKLETDGKTELNQWLEGDSGLYLGGPNDPTNKGADAEN